MSVQKYIRSGLCTYLRNAGGSNKISANVHLILGCFIGFIDLTVKLHLNQHFTVDQFKLNVAMH